jgi:hypothetical protein
LVFLLFFFNGVHADYHQNQILDKIEYDALKRAKLAFTIAWELANRENRFVDKKIMHLNYKKSFELKSSFLNIFNSQIIEKLSLF